MTLSYSLSRLQHLRSVADQARGAYLAVADRYRDARQRLQRLEAQQRQADARRAGDPLRPQPPDPSDLEMAQAEVARLEAQQRAAGERQQAVIGVRHLADEWIEQHRGVRARADDAGARDAPKGDDRLRSKIERLASEIADKRAERRNLSNSPLPIEEVERRLDDHLAGLRAQAGPLGGAGLVEPSYGGAEVRPVSLGDLAVIAPDLVRAALLDEARQWLASHPAGPPLAERRERLATLDTEIADAVARHVALCFAALDRGLAATFLPDTPPEILLSVEGAAEQPSRTPKIKGEQLDGRLGLIGGGLVERLRS